VSINRSFFTFIVVTRCGVSKINRVQSPHVSSFRCHVGSYLSCGAEHYDIKPNDAAAAA